MNYTTTLRERKIVAKGSGIKHVCAYAHGHCWQMCAYSLWRVVRERNTVMKGCVRVVHLA